MHASQPTRGVLRALVAVAVVACGCLALMVLWAAGRPLATPDLWFHLKAGETYLHQGLWPATDPMLFTGIAGGPVQHEWLFGVFAHGVAVLFGMQGLRVAHVLMVLGVLGLVAQRAWVITRAWSATALGVGVFAVLAWPRLLQFRPDLWTIAAVCGLHALVLAPAKGPGRAAVVAAALVQLAWFNAHSLAAIGLALLAATALGVAFQAGILQQASDQASDQPADLSQRQRDTRARLSRLTGTGALLTAVGLIHPRGVDQLLTFFASTSDAAIWEIGDEWSPFHPLSPAANRMSVSPLTWAVADAVLLAFAGAAIARLRQLKRAPTSDTIARFDPPAFLAAAAACGAMLISVRFLWLGVLPCLYVLSGWLGWERARPRAGHGVAALATVALAMLVWDVGRLGAQVADVPREPGRYLQTPVNRPRFADRAAQFLADVGAEGRVWTPYELGAYFGYRLAPRLRTFIDSRTEHYGADVFAEYKTITLRARHPDGRPFQRLLDDRRVDFFVGVGQPGFGYSVPYTLAHLDGVPGWLRVYRNAGLVVYLRAVPRNRENLARIARHYEALGVPFDPEQGIDVGRAIAERSAWAVAQGMVPPDFADRRRRVEDTTGPAAAAALLQLADLRFIAGDYVGATASARRAMDLGAPPAEAATTAMAALVRLGDRQRVSAFAKVLAEQHGQAPWAQPFIARFR